MRTLTTICDLLILLFAGLTGIFILYVGPVADAVFQRFVALMFFALWALARQMEGNRDDDAE